MDFFFPDSQDQIDPRFDWLTEEHLPFHVRQRDDRYAHEVHNPAPYRGILVSKTMVDGYGGAGRYTSPQRHRLYRLGVRDFFRLPKGLRALGDCGAFSYVSEEEPPVSVDEVVSFYETCRFDEGVSVDHVILDYHEAADREGGVKDEWMERQELTLRLAEEFKRECRRRDVNFTPMGVAQGWSPKSYAYAVDRLQKMDYKRIALGGMVPLKSLDILDCLEAISPNLESDTTLHLLGVTRTEHVLTFTAHGVTSFDSTSPFRQAFKDDKDNYYAQDRTYVALRVPPSDGNAKLQARVQAGQLPQREVREREKEALRALRAYDIGEATATATLDAIGAYETLHDPKRAGKRTEAYREMLVDAPWKRCPCGVCSRDSVEVAIFRGTERNKRRGFHNVWVFNQALQGRLAKKLNKRQKEREASEHRA